jgi:hypothetical protein
MSCVNYQDCLTAKVAKEREVIRIRLSRFHLALWYSSLASLIYDHAQNILHKIEMINTILYLGLLLCVTSCTLRLMPLRSNQ